MGAPNGSPETPPNAELSLRVYPEDGTLVWEAINEGTASVRLWQQGNSWGWPMPRLYLDSEPHSTAPHCLSPAARVWTRNFPASAELAPQESARYVLRAGDFDPKTLDPVGRRGIGTHHAPRVAAHLRVDAYGRRLHPEGTHGVHGAC